MKTQTFNSFLRSYARNLNPNNTLSLYKTEKLVENNSRLLTVFSFHVLFSNETKEVLEDRKEKLPNLYNECKRLENNYKDLQTNKLSEYVNHLDQFDELNQLYTSYNNLVVNKKNKLKETYYKMIINLQKSKKISTYRIYTDLDLNHGNTNDFIKNMNLNKLSFEQIKKIQGYCKTFHAKPKKHYPEGGAFIYQY